MFPQFNPQMPQSFPMGAGNGNADNNNLTSMDLDMGPVASRGAGGLNIQFFYMRQRIENAADATLHGTFQTRLCVAKQPKGDRLTIACQFIGEEQAIAQFPREYAMFKQYEAVPTTGTPLFDLPGVSQAQIGLLSIYGLRSVEDLVSMQEDQMNGMGMDAVQAYRVAKRWMEAKTANAPIIEQAQRDIERNQMLTRQADLEKQNAMLMAKLDAFMSMQAMQPQQPSQLQVAQMAAINMAMGNDDTEAMPESKLFAGGMVSDNSDLDIGLPGLGADPDDDPPRTVPRRRG